MGVEDSAVLMSQMGKLIGLDVELGRKVELGVGCCATRVLLGDS